MDDKKGKSEGDEVDDIQKIPSFGPNLSTKDLEAYSPQYREVLKEFIDLKNKLIETVEDK